MNGNGTGWKVAIFLAGFLIAGVAGVIRGDWLGDQEAQEVKEYIVEYHDRDFANMKEQLTRVEKKVDQLLQIQR